MFGQGGQRRSNLRAPHPTYPPRLRPADFPTRVDSGASLPWLDSGWGVATPVWESQFQCGSRNSSVGVAASVWGSQLQSGGRNFSVGVVVSVWGSQLQCGSRLFQCGVELMYAWFMHMSAILRCMCIRFCIRCPLHCLFMPSSSPLQ